MSGRSKNAIAKRDRYRALPFIKGRDALIIACRDKGMTLKATAEAVKHLDPTGQGWTTNRVAQIERYLRQ